MIDKIQEIDSWSNSSENLIEGMDGKGYSFPSGVAILLSRKILSMDIDDPSSPISGTSNLRDNLQGHFPKLQLK